MKLNTNYDTELWTKERQCLRCGTPMLANFEPFNPARISICDSAKLFPKKIKRVSCLVCPKCGEISYYTNDIEE